MGDANKQIGRRIRTLRMSRKLTLEKLAEMAKMLDEKGCDTALFSLYSIIPRKGHDILPTLPDFANLKIICLEEFRDYRAGRKAGHNVVYYRGTGGWKEFRFLQAFGRVNWQTQRHDIENFAQKRIPERVFGSCCILVCGESNGVPYDRSGSKNIHDACGVRAAIPPHVQVILNPVKVSRPGQNAGKAREDLILNPYPGIAAASRYPRGAPAASLRAFGGATCQRA